MYRELAASEPDEIALAVQIAEIARDLGRMDEAIAAFSRVAERYAADGLLLKAIAACKQILAVDAKHTKIQAMLADLYARHRRPRSTAGKPLVTRSGRFRVLPEGPSLQDLVIGSDGDREPAGDGAGAGAEAELEPALPLIPLFSALPKAAFISILDGMKMRELEAGERVISEGERGTSFFILSSGRVRVEKSTPDGQRVILAFLTDGAFFGEMAILQDTPRTASVIAESKSQILELDRKLLDETAEKFPVVARVLHDFYRDRVLATTMAVHPLFRPFGPAERRELMTQFRSRTFAAGDVLIQQGETGRGLYLLLSGELAVIADKKGEKKKLATLGPGEVFGEMSLLSEGPTAATVTASKESLVLRLDRQSFEGVAKKAPHVAELVEALREDRAESNRARLATPPPFTPGDGGVLV